MHANRYFCTAGSAPNGLTQVVAFAGLDNGGQVRQLHASRQGAHTRPWYATPSSVLPAGPLAESSVSVMAC